MTDFHGSKAAVFIGQKLLVYRRDDRADIPFPDHWDFPGGGREGSETPEETLFREIKEEFGLRLTASVIRWKKRFPAINHPDQFVWFFVLSLADDQVNHVSFGDEGQEWALMDWTGYLAQEKYVPSFKQRMDVWTHETGGRFD